jgi:hypothetical protein
MLKLKQTQMEHMKK